MYDPVTGKWSVAASLTVPRDYHTATLLPDGKVLVAGGFGISYSLASSELYDPDTGPWSITSNLNAPRRNDDQNPEATLIGKKAGRKIKSGDKLRVRNPDGALSEEFTFTGL